MGAAILLLWGIIGPDRSHLRTAQAFLPCAALLLLLAVSLGLWDRRRLRRGGRHASPSLAWLSKRLAAVAFGVGMTWAVLPLPWPAWALYLACFVLATGAGFYVANLPLRL